MPTSTSRLGIPVPVNTDPANVPGDMLNLANALDGGSNINYNGVAVIISAPGPLGSLPAHPIIGTIYPVNSAPPYLLYYSGESTPGTGTAPTGWRLVGQAGSNTATMSNSSPGNSVFAGVQPVWAPLDHRHASLPWSSGQTSSASGQISNDGVATAFSRADHSHVPPGLVAVAGTSPFGASLVAGQPLQTFMTSVSLGVGKWVVSTFTGMALNGLSSDTIVNVFIQEGTALATFSGPIISQTSITTTSNSHPASAAFTTLVNITQAGTLQWGADCSISNAQISSGSGYVAVPA